jgi:putative aldouronate transport system substrate-binding protein
MKKTVLLMASLALMLAPLFGGGQQGGGTSPSAGTRSLGTGRISYPIETDVTLTYWVAVNQNMAANYANLADTPFGKTRQEKTGVKVQYIHPPAGADTEQFNLIIASGDLPDIMERTWITYTGGPEKAISDGVILKLNDVFDRYGPNVKAYFNAHPDYDKMIKTDNGSYYMFPYIRGDIGLLVTNGPQIRKDWLDELGLPVPETIDDWHTALTAFKEKKGSRAPFTFTNWSLVPFAYAHGVPPRTFFIDDNGKVVYSPIQNGYRSYLALMAQWYREGLIDPDIATMQTSVLNQKMVAGVSGATAAQVGQGMGTWTTNARATNPQFQLTATPYPVLRRGDRVSMIYTSFPYQGGGCAAITTSCKNVEVAARFLDWNYSEEGHNLNNFGIEGVSYNMINDYPTFTDLIFNNPNGWPVAQSLASYALSQGSGPYIQDIRSLEQYYALPEQQAAVKTWPFPEMLKYLLPPVTPTPDESREYARIMGEINTYQTEMEIKFILGTEAITDASWSAYIGTINRMGIDRAIEIQNAALTRYNAR